MVQNLGDKSAKADVFMRFFESLFRCPCALALYREDFLLRSSRSDEVLFKAAEQFKPSLAAEEFPCAGAAQVLDAASRPCKSAAGASAAELQDRVVAVCLRPHKKNRSPEDSPSSPTTRKSTRGVYLFLQLKRVGFLARLLFDRDRFKAEVKFFDGIFSVVEREMLKKTDSL